MDNADSLWELAKASTLRVALAAASLVTATLAANQKKPGKREKNLGLLAGRLLQVHHVLERPSPDQQKLLWGRLEKLLTDLERVCTWSKDGGLQAWCPSKTPSLPFPTLYVIVSASVYHVAVVEKGLRLGLAAFATARPEIVDGYLSNLSSFSTSKRKSVEDVADAPEQSGGRTKEPLEAPDEYPAHVNQSLYAALHRHSSCTCSSSEGLECSSQRHWVRLRLKGRFQTRDNHILFDMFFSATPSPIVPNDEIRWQQLQLHVSRKMAGSKAVKILDKEAKESPPGPSLNVEHPQVVQVGKFCDLLRRRLGDVRICLNIQAGELCPLRDGEQIDQHIIPKPSIPLAKALEVRQLSTKMKIVLAYILARSVWQFYNSDWMKTRWTSEFIHFMPESSPHDEVDTEQPKIYACNPCFAFQFDDSDNSFTEYCGADHIGHRYPRVLALGIILVEIGGEAHEVGAKNQAQSLEEKINNDWMRGIVALKNERWPDFGFSSSGTVVQTYKTAVANCFDQKVFNAAMLPIHADAEQGIEERRAILYKCVVYPLEKLLRDMRWTDALEAIEPMDSTRPLGQPPRIQSAELLQSQSLNASTDLTHRESVIGNMPKNSKFCLFDDKVPSKAAADHANNWFKLLRENVFPILPMNPEPKNRVKIAILDTGIDMSEPFISTNRRRITTQSFLSEEGSVEDIHGHGTHAAALLLRVARNADIYVARITKTDDLLDPKSIENAIQMATRTWNVDIITMSFGFPVLSEDLKGIQSAINDAFHAQILMFCAASNGGGNRNIAYPANQDQVICVNSADGDGNPSGYNPDEPKPGRNLCALGEDVKSSWPTHFKLGQQRKSGTSFATPIAAALAAVVLDYARHKMLESDNFKVWKLRTRKGMLEVLERLMGRSRGGYLYLDPGKLFDKSKTNIYGSILDILVNV